MASDQLPPPWAFAETFLTYGWIPIALKGKRPVLSKWEQTTKDTSLALIKENVSKGKADNVGILTGEKSGIVVVDIDTRLNGLQRWEDLRCKYPQFTTFTVRTGSGGFHYYFQYDAKTMDNLCNRKLDKPASIDFKTTGGQVVGAGNIHPITKERYIVCDDGGYPVDKNDKSGRRPVIAPMPQFLFDLFRS